MSTLTDLPLLSEVVSNASIQQQFGGGHSMRLLYEGSRNIKNSLSCYGMSHVAVCAHVVINAEHDWRSR